jgi:hypothetical protein
MREHKAEHIVRDDRGGAKLIAWIWAAWLLIIVAALVLFPGKAKADDWKEISRSAWLAYYNRDIITPDGVLDCDDNMLVAYRYLKATGVASTPRLCTRNGNGHTYLLIQGRAIDNRSPFPMSEAEVGCD